MEKVLWMAIALLWLGMISAAAFAAEPQGPANVPATDVNVADTTPAASLLSVTQAISPAMPVRGITMTINPQPVIEAGQHGGAEMAGAFLIGAAALWSARRRRIV